jgi:hypothetical protein
MSLIMKTWTPEEPLSIASLAPSDIIVCVEKYAEERNGFSSGDIVRLNLPDGVAAVQITKSTQTTTPLAMPSDARLPEQYAGSEHVQTTCCLAVVRFRLLKVLQPGDPCFASEDRPNNFLDPRPIL